MNIEPLNFGVVENKLPGSLKAHFGWLSLPEFDIEGAI
jgi:hypothetical protein